MNKRYLLAVLVCLSAYALAKNAVEVSPVTVVDLPVAQKEIIEPDNPPVKEEEKSGQKENSEKDVPSSEDTEQKEPIKEAVAPESEPEEELVNKIAIVVYTDEDPIMITQHTLDCKSLDGRAQTKKEILMEHLMCYEALTFYKMPITDDMVDKHLASLKEQHGVGDKEIRQLFKESGYTYQEGREKLRASYAIQSLMGQLVDGRVVVTEKEVQAFYKKNPLKEEASFRIQTALITDDDLTDMQLQDLVEDGRYKDLVTWNSPYWLDKDEIVDSKLFITSMKQGEVRTEKVIGGTQAIMLLQSKKERIRPLEECRREITAMIRAPRRKEVFEKYEQELLNKYDIVYIS